MKFVNFFLFFIISGYAAEAFAVQTFHSGNQRVSVLELYTSEGCSSCPPADRWLGELKNDDRLWRELIPVAFHVDYWNYIGWPDRFASEHYSERQRRYARTENVTTVYTPGFVLNGREWRSFFGLQRLSLVNEKAGVLELNVDGNHVTGTYTPLEQNAGSVDINIAILGFDLETRVNAGENRGKVLRHDFTVLGLVKKMMQRNGDNTFTVSSRLPDTVVTAPRMAIAAWVNLSGDQAPVQAAGGWLTQ